MAGRARRRGPRSPVPAIAALAAALVAAITGVAAVGAIPGADLPAVTVAGTVVDRDASAGVDVIVRGVDAVAAAAAVDAVGGRVMLDLPLVDGVAARVPADRIGELRAAAGVVDVALDEAVHVQADVSPVHEATGVFADAVGAPALWAEGVDGRGVTVAVIDTGIARVPDLAGRLVAGVDFTPEGDPFRDSFGHGTFVAGMAAADGTTSGGTYRGVAPGAGLVALKIADRTGASDVTHVIAALQWAVSFRETYGIRVVNLSLGTDSTQSYRLSPLNFAVERAWDAGLVVVVSASNLGLGGPSSVTKPGDDPLVVTVGATDDLMTATVADDVMAGFSGTGPTAADGLAKPDLVAPGRSVVSLRAPGSAIDDAYPSARVGTHHFKGSGTSFSAGVVSGAAALVLQREPDLTPDQVKHRLLSTSAPGPVGDPHVDGHGSLDAFGAAHAGTFTAANQGVPRSLGTGSLQADRGSLQVTIETGTDPLVGPLTQLLTGDLTATGDLFDQGALLTAEWNPDTWTQSQWYGTKWYGTKWYGTKWYGTKWYSTEWYGTKWYGVGWE